MSQSKLYFVLLIFFISLSSNVFSKDKFMKASITLLDGEVKSYYLKFPVSSTATKLIVKQDEQSKKQSIKTEEIDFFKISDEKGNFIFKFTDYYFRGKKGRIKTDHRPLLLLYRSCQNYQTFVKSTEYDIDKRGNFIFRRAYNSVRTYFFQRVGEKHPFDLSTLIILGDETKIPIDRKEEFINYVKHDSEFQAFVKSSEIIGLKKLDSFLDSICN